MGDRAAMTVDFLMHPINFVRGWLWSRRTFDENGIPWWEYECDCTPHDITTPGAAHADDCPKYD